MKLFALLHLAVIFVWTHTHAQAEQVTGRTWKLISEDAKSAYLHGLFDGDKTARYRIYFDHFSNKNPAENKRIADDILWPKVWPLELTVDEMVSALDAFYADYRNINIDIAYALEIVGLQISGEPDAKIIKMLETARSTSSPQFRERISRQVESDQKKGGK